jgi:hypothetical protein
LPIPEDPKEEFPAAAAALGITDDTVIALFGPFLGRSFGYALEKFRPTIRNAGAQMDPDKDVLSIDRYDDLASCYRVAPVLQFIARRMLENEFRSAEGSS